MKEIVVGVLIGFIWILSDSILFKAWWKTLEEATTRDEYKKTLYLFLIFMLLGPIGLVITIVVALVTKVKRDLKDLKE